MTVGHSSSAETPAVPAAFKDVAFRRRRLRNWLVLGFLYAFFYMTRYNFAAVMVNLSASFKWTNTQLGFFETMMPLVYGVSVVLNGPLADRIGGRRAFLFGAVGVTVMNLLFGACIAFRDSLGLEPGSQLALMATIWGINGYFQSFGALSIVKVNAQWFHVRERGTFAGIFGVLIRLGLSLAFSVVPFIVADGRPLQYAFWVPGVCVGVMFVLNFFWLAETPHDAGFNGLDTGDGTGVSVGGDERPAPIADVLRKVFANRVTWIIAFSSMMIGMVRRSSVDSWYPKYFKEVHLGGAGASLASYLPYQMTVWGIVILGILGGFAFGIASDRVFKGRRAPVIGVGFVGMALALALFGVIDRAGAGPYGAVVCLSLLSFFVNGAHGMVGGAASMDFGGRKAAATAAGLFDGMQYLASSFVGIGMGYTLDHWGWQAWHWVPIPFAIIGAFLISRIWHATPASVARRVGIAKAAS